MFIPFVLVQPILAAITLAATAWDYPTGDQRRRGLCRPVWEAFFNSNGSVAALLVALFNLGVATTVYLPFGCCRIKRRPLSSRKKGNERHR
ncbi:hypothetical protein MJ575_12290 [Klebsiella pneumoniae]|nr:hypothetical protein MJ575_12290 [Klebsiella pneumoniae]